MLLAQATQQAIWQKIYNQRATHQVHTDAETLIELNITRIKGPVSSPEVSVF